MLRRQPLTHPFQTHNTLSIFPQSVPAGHPLPSQIIPSEASPPPSSLRDMQLRQGLAQVCSSGSFLRACNCSVQINQTDSILPASGRGHSQTQISCLSAGPRQEESPVRHHRFHTTFLSTALKSKGPSRQNPAINFHLKYLHLT